MVTIVVTQRLPFVEVLGFLSDPALVAVICHALFPGVREDERRRHRRDLFSRDLFGRDLFVRTDADG